MPHPASRSTRDNLSRCGREDNPGEQTRIRTIPEYKPIILFAAPTNSFEASPSHCRRHSGARFKPVSPIHSCNERLSGPLHHCQLPGKWRGTHGIDTYHWAPKSQGENKNAFPAAMVAGFGENKRPHVTTVSGMYDS